MKKTTTIDWQNKTFYFWYLCWKAQGGTGSGSLIAFQGDHFVNPWPPPTPCLPAYTQCVHMSETTGEVITGLIPNIQCSGFPFFIIMFQKYIFEKLSSLVTWNEYLVISCWTREAVFVYWRTRNDIFNRLISVYARCWLHYVEPSFCTKYISGKLSLIHKRILRHVLSIINYVSASSHFQIFSITVTGGCSLKDTSGKSWNYWPLNKNINKPKWKFSPTFDL